MKSRSVRILPLLASFMLSLSLLTGCGGSKRPRMTETAAASGYSVPMEAPAVSYKMAVMDDAMEEAAAESFDMDSAAGGSNGSAAKEYDPKDLSSESQTQRKLIRNFDISAKTKEYDASMARIRSSITGLGGYIESMSEYGGEEYGNTERSAWISARIPCDKADAFMNSAFEGAAITSRSESTEDITLRYTDLAAHLKTLRTEQDKLTELLAQADSIEAVIALEGRLSEISYKIESIEQSLRTYDNQVTYSTVSINLSEVKTIEAAKEAGIGERISSGLTESFNDLGDSIVDFIVWLIVSIPFFLVFAAFIFIIWLLIIRPIRKHLKKEKTAGAASVKAAAASVKIDSTLSDADADDGSKET